MDKKQSDVDNIGDFLLSLSAIIVEFCYCHVNMIVISRLETFALLNLIDQLLSQKKRQIYVLLLTKPKQFVCKSQR